jgi:hypothetical protein
MEKLSTESNNIEYINCLTNSNNNQPYIYTDSGGNKILLFSPTNEEDNEYGFNINWVPREQLFWFASVFSRSIEKCYLNTKRRTIRELREKIIDFMSLLGFDMKKITFWKQEY